MPNTKIATCCYCGTRAALVLDKRRHELACASCGAPLHDLKNLRAGAVDRAAHAPVQEGRKGKRRAVHSPLDGFDVLLRGQEKGRKKRKRKKKGRWHEVFDLIEDIFD
ncbi:hypothetical protein [Sagittula salina]|uniref:TFIIB-type zinc ribbon-containing protein n=1 Tax=Sagittula salina TaxID=2820268 RepID=A0A940MK61_9RHOB|nr:hypothetical protein [Sagittula salina]MBP0481275.1 hypothetical protein [Sagittula salina]